MTKKIGIRRIALFTYSGLLSPKVLFACVLAVMIFVVVCSLRSFLIPVLTHSESNNCFCIVSKTIKQPNVDQF